MSTKRGAPPDTQSLASRLAKCLMTGHCRSDIGWLARSHGATVPEANVALNWLLANSYIPKSFKMDGFRRERGPTRRQIRAKNAVLFELEERPRVGNKRKE